MSASPRETARVLLRMIFVALAASVNIATAAVAQSKVGVAYDSVTKLVSSSDPPLRLRDFAADFRAGLHPSPNCTPSLIRRYLTTRKERIDDVCRQQATIIDCETRTATLLDLGTKTYAIVRLDASFDDGIADASALSASTGTTSKLAILRTALGPKNVGGALTDEYTESYEQSIVSSDLSVTTRDSWTYYLSPASLPRLACIDVAAPWLSRYGTPQRYEPELQQSFETRIAEFRSSRFLVSESGPRLPSWRIVIYSVYKRFQRQSGVDDFTNFFELESGNMRAIDDDDPAFTRPSYFTKMPQ